MARGIDVEFIDDNIVVVGSTAGIEFIRTNGDSEKFSLPELSQWAASASEHKLALATTRGQAVILESFPLHVAARAELCHGPIAGLAFVPGRQSIAYACREGAIGIWDLRRGEVSPRAQLEGNVNLITTSPTGDYIIAAGGNGTITVLDLYTDLIASYKGHGFRPTSLTPPTPEHPFLISGDAQGTVRAWPMPPRFARVAATSSSPFHRVIFDNQSTMVMATTWLPALTIFSPSSGVRPIGPHEPDNVFLERSNNGRTFATYGLHDLVEIWSYETSSAPMKLMRIQPTKHGSVSQLRFVGDTDDFITSGHDGRLVRWTPLGEGTLLTQSKQPIDTFVQASATGPIVFSTVDGALWRTDAGGQALSLRGGGSRVNRILAVPDQLMVYAGYANGDVIAINTKSWQQEIMLQGSGSVQEIAITSDGHTIAVSMNDGTIHVNTHHDDASSQRRAIWIALAARARHITLAPDGLLVASCTDGTIWLYFPPRRRSLSLPTGTADLGQTAVAANGKAAVVLDREGRLIWIDLEAARELL